MAGISNNILHISLQKKKKNQNHLQAKLGIVYLQSMCNL